MKKGREKNLEVNIPDITDSISTVKEEYNQLHNRNTILINLLPIIAVMTVIIVGIIKQTPVIDILKSGVLTIILTTTSVFFVRLQGEDLLSKKFSNEIMIIGYLLSILLILLPVHPDIYCFWMLGGLAVAMLVDGKLGLIYIFNHTFLLSFTLSIRPESILYYLAMGILMCILSEALRNKTTVIYAAIIILSTNITLSFVLNNFLFEVSTGFNYLSSFFSIFAVLVTAFLLSVLYERFIGKISSATTGVTSNSIEETKEEKMHVLAVENGVIVDNESKVIDLTIPENSEGSLEVTPTNIYYDKGARTSYELLIADHNGLLERIKEFSEGLYQHSLQIGELSYRAAKLIHADYMLAKAGGLYHEVGKIKGKDYIEEGQKIADEHAFPKELKAILKQHNIKHEKPTSVEAAIVMLSDNVVSTIEYIKKTEDNRYTSDKIIDNLFQLRMEKGTFDEAGLSIRDYKALKEFYQKEFR